MRPHPRIRKTVKWGGTAVTVLLVVVWVGSGWVCAEWIRANGNDVYLEAGKLGMRVIGDPKWANAPVGVQFGFTCFEVVWGVHWSASPGVPSYLYIPLWLPSCLISVPTILMWRLDTLARRRAKLNRCAKCDYDRTGLAIGAVCPECGSAPP
jgi:hypothetical protein